MGCAREALGSWRNSRPPQAGEPLPSSLSLYTSRCARHSCGREADLGQVEPVELAPFEPRAGAAFGLSVVVNDDDGLEAGGPTWVELTPGAGSGRTPFPLDRVVLE